MKFFCEYCGCRIDSNIDDKCPNCGASYKKNKTFIGLEEERKEKIIQREKLASNVINGVANTFKFSKYIMIIPIIMFIVVFIIVISTFITIGFNFRNHDSGINNDNIIEIDDNVIDKEDSVVENEPIIEDNEPKDIVVNFNEYAEAKDYKVKVTKYEKVEFWYKEPEKGYEYIKFYFQVENTSGNQITKKDVYCIVDGVSQTNDFTSGYSDIPTFINKGLTVKGTATFEVPKNTDSYDIKYGDYVTIHIKK